MTMQVLTIITADKDYRAFKKGTKIIDGESPWNVNLTHMEGQILSCGAKQWRVSKVDKIHHCCFVGTPQTRRHCLILEPLGHQDQPNVGDILI
jgi:hypothetical protein